MNCRELNRAFQYIDDKYLELVEKERNVSGKKIYRIPRGIIAACILGAILLVGVPAVAIAGNWFGVRDSIVQSDLYQKLIKEKDPSGPDEKDSETSVGWNEGMPGSSLGENGTEEYTSENGTSAWEEVFGDSGMVSSINEGNLFSVLSMRFYKSADRDISLKVNRNGTFVGMINDCYYYDNFGFKGKFVEPIKLADGIYATRVESINWDKETREDKSATEDLLNSIGLSEGAKIRIYLPGASLDNVDPGYLAKADFTNNRKAIPKNVHVLYNITDDVDFVAKEKTSEHYEGKTGDYFVGWTVDYNKCYLGFNKCELVTADDGTEDVAFIESVTFSGEVDDDLQTDFILKKYADEGWSSFVKNSAGIDQTYQIRMEYLDDREEEIKLTIKSADGEDFTKWGGTETGTLTVNLRKGRTPYIQKLKGNATGGEASGDKDTPGNVTAGGSTGSVSGEYELAIYSAGKDVFSVIPSELEKGDGRYSMKLNLNPDGSFTGVAVINLEEKNKRYLCECKGNFSEPERVKNGVYSSMIDRLEWVSEHRREIVDGREDIYENYEVFEGMFRGGGGIGFYEEWEIEIYFPGTPLSETNEVFAKAYKEKYGEDCEYIPEDSCVICQISYYIEGWFEAKMTSAEYGHYGSKQRNVNISLDINSSGIQVNLFTDEEREQYIYDAYINPQRVEIDEQYGYCLSGGVAEEGQTDFILERVTEHSSPDSPTGPCQLHIDYLDDRKETVQITITCENGGNLIQWGGAADGTFTARLKVDPERSIHRP